MELSHINTITNSVILTLLLWEIFTTSRRCADIERDVDDLASRVHRLHIAVFGESDEPMMASRISAIEKLVHEDTDRVFEIEKFLNNFKQVVIDSIPKE